MAQFYSQIYSICGWGN